MFYLPSLSLSCPASIPSQTCPVPYSISPHTPLIRTLSLCLRFSLPFTSTLISPSSIHILRWFFLPSSTLSSPASFLSLFCPASCRKSTGRVEHRRTNHFPMPTWFYDLFYLFYTGLLDFYFTLLHMFWIKYNKSLSLSSHIATLIHGHPGLMRLILFVLIYHDYFYL